jgi:hypothetical protein
MNRLSRWVKMDDYDNNDQSGDFCLHCAPHGWQEWGDAKGHICSKCGKDISDIAIDNNNEEKEHKALVDEKIKRAMDRDIAALRKAGHEEHIINASLPMLRRRYENIYC